MESGDEDEVTVGAREYKKMERGMWKSGFREGASKGKEQGLQASFDAAYQLAYKYASKFGQLQGQIECIIALEPNTREELQPLLENLKEYFESCFLKTDFQTDENFKSAEQIWTSKLNEFIDKFISVYPKALSSLQDLKS